MAGGMDWFRWHHGSVNDQKFPLVARRAGASVAEVIAVWACLLERASMNEGARGTLGQLPDFEAMDCALGLPDGRTEAIFAAMQQRDLVDGDMHITAWTRRQPKREDSTAAERKRAQRERDAIEPSVKSGDVTQRHDESRDVTTEERRREENSSSLRSEGERPKRAPSPPPFPCPDDVDVQVWADWLALRKAKKAPVTQTVLKTARHEAGKAEMSFESFLRIWCARGSQGLHAEWLKPHELRSAGRAPMPNRQEVLEESNLAAAAAFAGG